MKRLYFRLPRQPVPPVRRTRSTTTTAPRLTFQELADLMEPQLEPSSVWRKAVDREACVALFFQLNLRSDEPRLAKCVCLRLQEFRVGAHADLRLVPSVFLDEPLVVPETEPCVPLPPTITSATDVVKLLQNFELYPHLPDDEENGVPRTLQESCAEECGVEGVLVMGDSDGEMEFVDDNDAGDYSPAEGLVEEADTVTKLKGEKCKPKKFSKRPKATSTPGLNEHLLASMQLIKVYLHQAGPDKKELYPEAGMFACSKLVKKFHEKHFRPLRYNKIHPQMHRLKAMGASIALDLIDSLGKVSDQLPSQQCALLELIDKEFLQTVANFVNLNDPRVVKEDLPPLSTDQLLRGMRNRIKYLKVLPEMLVAQRRLKQRKKEERKRIRTGETLPPPVLGPSAPSLISPLDNGPWNPDLPYNHPDFRVSYLVDRPDYVSLWPGGDNPQVYIKQEWYDYFTREQSHVDYPRDQNWIRALLFKIIDEHALLHMCLQHRQRERQGVRVAQHTLLSTGFLKILEEFIRCRGSICFDTESLLYTFADWFKDYKRNINRKGILDQDPATLKPNRLRTARRKGYGRSTMQ
ncbi:uncharacterized protein LOC129590759 [Paramacrobiotus metropolitanus]|uniref:uncharacterized protein LOC129590759 n=1 Tax=Paramacrobiotus metropolitanus TaxID=2943436 RepID=UPI0024455EEE|nr:uncharacterized protein LOC129590759 [Paramacrobiotus metropolitanus]XP_055342105.1 uncharacterized protein LOC129590759 [Paramacrobiotus metropolitanus]